MEFKVCLSSLKPILLKSIVFLAVPGISLLLASPLVAIEKTFCSDQPICVDDTLTVRFDENGSTEISRDFLLGEEIRVGVYLDANSTPVVGEQNCTQPPPFNENDCGSLDPLPAIVECSKLSGFSYGVKHDPALLEIIRATKTGSEPIVFGADFNITAFAEGSLGFVSAVVITTDACPPFDIPALSSNYRVATAFYRVIAPIPSEGTRLEFTEELSPRNSPPIAIAMTYEGEVFLPRTLNDAELRGFGVEDTLALGVPLAFTLNSSQPRRLYRFVPAAESLGKTLLLKLDSTTPDPGDAHALYVGWGAPPTSSVFDGSAAGRMKANQRLLIPLVRNDVCYILVQANGIDVSPDQVTLVAEVTDLALLEMSASSAGQGASAISAAILGAGFDSDTNFSLVQPGGGVSVSGSLDHVVSSRRGKVSFDLSGAPVGQYDLRAERPGALAGVLENAFEVKTSETGPVITAEISSLEIYRLGRLARLTLHVRNVGDEEVAAPLFKIIAPVNTELQLKGEEGYQLGETQVLGIHPGGIAGMLPPGVEVEIPVTFRISECTECDMFFGLGLLTPTLEDLVGWGGLPVPEGMLPADWDRVWPKLSSNLGTTWREYQRSLGRLATRLSRRGVHAESVVELFRFAVREALGRPTSAVMGEVVHEASGEPLSGLPVLALQGGTAVSSTMTDSEGAFALDWLEPNGTYELALLDYSVTGTGTGSLQITLTGSLRLTLPDSGDLSGLVLMALPEQNGLIPASPNRDESGLPLKAILPPTPLFTLVNHLNLRAVSSWRANAKDGPAGEGADGLIGPEEEILYTIYFENQAGASGAVKKVVVVDQLDPDLDWSTFMIRDVKLGDDSRQFVALDRLGRDLTSGYARSPAPEGFSIQSRLMVTQELSPGNTRTLPVVLGVEMDLQTGVATWTLDTESADPLAGFLLPNDDLHQGEGHVSFTIMPLPGLAEGTTILNTSSVYFDELPRVQTNARFNKISYLLLPDVPRNPTPPSGTGRPVEADQLLQWEAPRATSHDFFLWEAGAAKPSPLVLFENFFRPPGGLLPGTTYHWQVVAKNPNGIVEGAEWTFATVSPPCPAPPTAPSPTYGSVNLTLNPVLDWEGGIDVSTYTVYLWPLGETRPASALAENLSESALAVVQALAPGTGYEWQVVAVNSFCETPGPVWRFTTMLPCPAQPAGPTPSPGMVDVGLSFALDWNPAADASTYNLFFWLGTDPKPGQPAVTGLVESGFNVPGTLEPATEYRWQVVAVNSSCETPGPAWSFTTVLPCPGASMNPSPGVSATGVALKPTLDWLEGAYTSSHDLFLWPAAEERPATPHVAGLVASSYTVLEALQTGTEYAWQVVGVNPGCETRGPVWSFTTGILCPAEPTGATPAPGEIQVASNPVLDWETGIDTLTYSVFLWPPGEPRPGVPLAEGLVDSTFQVPGPLSLNTVYQWQVVAVNLDCQTPGPIWSFTTILPCPGEPGTPSPLEGASGVALNPVLDWAPVSDVSTYRVFLWRASEQKPASPIAAGLIDSVLPVIQTLQPETEYRWQVMAVNTICETPGPVWSFTTLISCPTPPAGPMPPTGATQVALNPDLDWQPSLDASSYSVFLWLVGNPRPGRPVTEGLVDSAFHVPGPLSLATEYQWQVVAVNSGCEMPGPVWTFTTVLPCPAEPAGPSPVVGSSNVALNPVLDWAQMEDGTTYSVFLWILGEPKPTSPIARDLLDSVYRVDQALLNSVTYEWQVVAVNSSCDTPGPVWNFTTIYPCPDEPAAPSPLPGTTEVSVRPLLEWGPGANVSIYGVFLWPLGETRPEPMTQGLVASKYLVEQALQPGTEYLWQVVAENPTCAISGPIWNFTTAAQFHQRGDVNRDDILDVTDVIVIIGYQFRGESIECVELANTNGDDLLDVSDAIFLLNYLFQGGPKPTADASCGQN